MVQATDRQPLSGTSKGTTQGSSSAWSVEVFFDGDCPLCKREIQMLQWMDRKRQRIRFTDIAAAGFSPELYGKSHQEFMDEIQGRMPDGSWITGVEVFRQLYSAVGLSWLAWGTRLPVVSHSLEWGYQRFAKNRLKWTGRCTSDSCSVR